MGTSKASTTNCATNAYTANSFGTLAEARVILESWRVEYNQHRPHSSLGYHTPEEFAQRSKFGLQSAYLLASKLAQTELTSKNLIKQKLAELHF